MFSDFEMAEIKGLMVDITGNPSIEFETEKQLDEFLDDVEKIIFKRLRTQQKELLRTIIENLPITEDEKNREWIKMVKEATKAGFINMISPEDWWKGRNFGRNSYRQQIKTLLQEAEEKL